MKIAIDGRLINKYHNTGISRYTEFLIDYYTSQFPKSIIYLIVNNKHLEYDGVQVVYYPYKPYNIIGFIKFTKFIRLLRVSLLHSPFYAGLWAKTPYTKNVITVHDLMYKLVPGFFGSNTVLANLKIMYFDFIVKKSLKNADIVISVSKTTANDVKTYYQLDSSYIPEDSEIMSNPDPNTLQRYKLQPKNYFFYCGNSRPHKNLNFIIKIFNSNPALPVLVLAGKGHVSSQNVRSIGIVSDNELNSLYSNCCAFIFPSKYEGFGLPILETLRCRSIVVASNISAFMEFKSSNILFFDLGDEEKLLEQLLMVQKINYFDEPAFFNYYSKEKIHQLLNNIILD